MARRVLILAAGVGSGHNMAASAIEASLATLGDVGEVHRLDILETTNEVFSRLYDDAYFTLVSEVPWLVGWGYDHQDPPFKLAPLVQWWDQINTTSTVRQIRDYDPDVVICTHFLPARLVSLMLARRQLRATLCVVATDYDFQGLWLTAPLTHFFAAREETARYMTDLGMPSDRVSAVGIPVRPELAEPVDAAGVRARFGLDPELPVVLISAGAAGGAYTSQVVRQTLRMEQPFQAVVVCGRNATLKAEIEALVAARAGSYRVLGYTEELAALMRVATIFVGKPGGLSASECMAAGLPMLVVNPIPGQEERNSDYLLEEGAAVRCNYATTVGFKLDRLLADPARLSRMAANARRIGRPAAGRDVVDFAMAADERALWISRDARRSMLLASQQGVAVADLEPARRLRTLSDPASGRSLALVTGAQLDALGVPVGARTVELGLSRMRALQWVPDTFDVAMTGRWVLDATEERTVSID